MTITLRPEQEQLVAEMLHLGAYHNASEVIERALQLLHEHEKWLADTRAKIEEGYAAAERGELIDGDEVRARLEEHERNWLAQHEEVVERDLETLAQKEPNSPQRVSSAKSAGEAVADILEVQKRNRLDGLKIKDVIHDGHNY